MSAEHTPGRWRVVEDNYSGELHQMLIDERGITLFDSLNRSWAYQTELADMTLAAAAPDLLAALQHMVRQFSKTPSTFADSQARVQAHEAINKATGGAA